MSSTSLTRSRSARLAAALVASLALATAVGTPADAVTAPGSPFQVFVDTGTANANPADAIQSGWWGHEGGAHDGTGMGTSFLDVDGANPALATTFPDLSKVRVAFVTTSSDGSAEHPAVTAGESVGSAFPWFMDAGVQTGLNGNTNPNDSVNTVSTGAEFNAWDSAGQPVQGYDNSLVLHDVTAPGNPVSAAPKGKSILDRWAAGQHISLVFYATTGALDAHGQPIVAVGSDGHAITAYMPFDTVQKAGDAVRTSAGYQLSGPYAPNLSLTPSYSAGGTTLTVTVKKKDGTTVATDATGNVEFAQVVGGVDQTATPVAVSNGTAVLSMPALTPGNLRTYDARYVPDVAGQASYLTTGYSRITLNNPSATATTTALTITGGATDTLAATVSPASATGTVTFQSNGATLGVVAVAGGRATLSTVLAGGQNVVSATFTPSSGTYLGSTSAAAAVWQPAISTRLKPLHPRRGARPTMIVKVVAPGATVSGRVTLVVDPPKGATKRITVSLVGGSATVKLPKVVKGKTVVTVMYLGSGQVLAANKLTRFKVS